MKSLWTFLKTQLHCKNFLFPLSLAIYAILIPSIEFAFLPIIIIVAFLLFSAVLYRPIWGLYLLIFNISLNQYVPIFGVGGDSFSISVNELLVLVLVLSLLLHWLMGMKNKLILPTTTKYLFAFILVSLISLIWAGKDISQGDYIKCWMYFFLWIEYFLIFPFIFLLVKTEQQAKIIFFLIILSAFITIISAIQQQLSGTELMSIGAITSDGKVYYRLISRFGFRSNLYGAYLLFILAMLFNYLFLGKSHKWLIAFAILPVFYTTFYTFSRAAFLGFLVLSILVFIVHKKQRKKMLLFFILFSIIAGTTFAPIFKRWSDKSLFREGGQIVLEHNIKARLASWDASMHEFVKRPLLGGGFQTFHYRFIDYQSKFGIVQFINLPDNQYIKILIENGLIGLSLFFMFIFSFFRKCKQLLTLQLSIFQQILIYSTAMAFTCFLVNGLTDSMITATRVTGQLFVLLALVMIQEPQKVIAEDV